METTCSTTRLISGHCTEFLVCGQFTVVMNMTKSRVNFSSRTFSFDKNLSFLLVGWRAQLHRGRQYLWLLFGKLHADHQTFRPAADMRGQGSIWKRQFTLSTCTNLYVLGTLSQWRSLSRTSTERKDFHERKILLVPEGNQIDDECCWIVDNSQEQIYCLDFEGCNLPDPIFVPTLRQNEFSPFKCPLGLKLCADRQTCSFIRHQVSVLQRIHVWGKINVFFIAELWWRKGFFRWFQVHVRWQRTSLFVNDVHSTFRLPMERQVLYRWKYAKFESTPDPDDSFICFQGWTDVVYLTTALPSKPVLWKTVLPVWKRRRHVWSRRTATCPAVSVAPDSVISKKAAVRKDHCKTFNVQEFFKWNVQVQTQVLWRHRPVCRDRQRIVRLELSTSARILSRSNGLCAQKRLSSR